jgi:hypothetical protein
VEKYYIESSRKGTSHTITRRKTDRIGHIVHVECLLKHVIEGKIEGRMGVTGRN